MKLAALPLALVLLALPGCSLGSDDAAPVDDESDKPGATLSCLDEKGIEARLDGEDAVVVGDGEAAPRIEFFLTAGESEAAQFKGKGEGAEQIGSALLYVRDGSDDLLEDVELCLADL
jgi:hypothetical protein